jgi:acyl dehydratase
MSERYLEDYVVGQKFGSGRIRVDKDRIKAFAAEFDPQPFHLDEALASERSSADWRQAAGTPPP